jgi:hypothetical protein
VDIIVSEWMGVYLLHESMLKYAYFFQLLINLIIYFAFVSSVLFARDKWLNKETGLMYPSVAYLYVCPVQMRTYLDETLKYWQNYNGLSFEPMRRIYRELLLEKPIVETITPENMIDEEKLLASFDLKTIKQQDLESVQAYNLEFVSSKKCNLHGFAFWFDVIFNTDEDCVTLSTSPTCKSTHWKQTIALLPEVILSDEESESFMPESNQCLNEGDKFECYVLMNQSEDNARTYLIDIGVNFNLDENNQQDSDGIDDDDGEEHPMPCKCNRLKCVLIKATLEKYENEKSSIKD